MTREYDLIAASGLFDADYYLRNNGDVASEDVDPLQHFLEQGWREGRKPNSLFDPAWYLDTYPEVAQADVNPLFHYLRFGGFTGRDPSVHFDSRWYLEEYADVGEEGINPLSHYLGWGQFEGRLAKKPGTSTSARDGLLAPYESWLAVNELSDRDIAHINQKIIECSARLPKISLITPVYDTHAGLLQEVIDSVTAQLYENWELCLVNDASAAAHVAPLLDRLARSDRRIRIKHLKKNGGISVATNAGVEMATGEVIAFLDHDDLLTRDCLAELAFYYADHPEADIVYSDDDKIDLSGRRYAPQFKPDWSPTLLLSWMYFSHVFSVRKNLFQRIGGFRSEFDGSQDYDFALRAAEEARHIGHIPKILYHWRASEGSTATSGAAKPESMQRGLRAVQEALDRRGIRDANAIHPEWAAQANVGMFDVVFPDDGPSVTLIIPTKDKLRLLRTCLESLKKTTYRNFDVLIVDNGSEQQATCEYLDAVDGKNNIRVVRIENPPEGFSFAHLNNRAVLQCTSDYVLFLNNDTEVISPNWLSQMVGYAGMRGVGAVGARLYFQDRTLQHAGIVHGYHEGLVGHAFRGLAAHDWGYLGFVRSSREYSGVTAACLLTARALFEELGGFDEANFAVAYNDVDYCYRVVKSGRTCVYCASAELWHYEGKSRGFRDNPAERLNFRRLYGDWYDPWYNPNLSLENEKFEIESVRPDTTAAKPVRLVAVTHNLNNEGAPTTLMDLVRGLTQRGIVDPAILSPADGPLRQQYEAAGIRVIILERLMYGVKDFDTQLVGLAGIGTLLKALGADVVLANTLQTYWAIKGAKLVGLPSIWAQHESEPWDTYFDYLPPDMRGTAYEAFADAYRVLYVADATRRSWRPVETRRNFKVIRHGIPPERLVEETERWTRRAARKKLGISSGSYVLSVVGTLCRRKGQLDLVDAFAKLPPDLQEKTCVYIAGKIAEQDYAEELKKVINEHGLADSVVLTDHIEDPFLYYAASDVSICTSRIESAPRIIVEAMACGLPIITTPVFGIPELVEEGVNALYYDVGDAEALASAIEKLLSNDALRAQFASNSPNVLKGQPGFNEMVEQYGRTIRQAASLSVVK